MDDGRSAVAGSLIAPGQPTRASLGALLVACLALLAHWGVSHNAFIALDDDRAIVDNPHTANGITWESIRWAFTDTQYYDYWHPLPWLSHMADIQLFGMRPGAHHVTSLAIHMVSSAILFLALLALTRRRLLSLSCAALFAVHPIHVESVAWAVERKDVLCALFWHACVLSYATYAKTRKRSLLWTSFGLHLLSMMAKPMLVTAPVLLLLLDYWPLRRFGGDADEGRQRVSVLSILAEKVPFALTSAVFSLLTIVAVGGKNALPSVQTIPIPTRLANVTIAYGQYVLNMLWPVNLALFYPYRFDVDPARLVVPALLLTTVTALVVRYRRRLPCLVFGWSWYLLALTPVVGLVQTGSQAYADRFMYIPSLGLYMMFVCTVARLRRSVFRVPIRSLLMAVAIFALIVATNRQVRFWRDSETLFRHTLQAAGDSPLVLNNLGVLLKSQRRYSEATEVFRRAMESNPADAYPVQNLASCLIETGRPADALPYLRLARSLSSTAVAVPYNLALAHRLLGDTVAARLYLDTVLTLMEDDAESHRSVGDEYAALREWHEAEKHLQTAVRQSPGSWKTHNSLGSLELARTRPVEALAHFHQASLLAPEAALPLCNAAIAFLQLGMVAEALASAEDAASRDPALGKAYMVRGAAFEQLGQIDSALTQYRRACTLPVPAQGCPQALDSLLTRALVSDSLAGHRTEALTDTQSE